MKRLYQLIGLLLLTSCNSNQNLSENEEVCRISGEGFEIREIRVCPVWSDMRNGDKFHEVKVRNGCFDAEVVLDTNQVYEICIPHPEYGFNAYRTAEFFYSKEGVRFGLETEAGDEKVILKDPTGTNRTWFAYKDHRDSLFRDWYADLMESQDSLNNTGQMYDPHWLEMLEVQNDDNVPQDVKDSITLEVNKLSMSGEHRTPAGQRWEQEWNSYLAAKQDYDFKHLSESVPDAIGLFIIMNNINISNRRAGDISKWLDIYDDRYRKISETDRMHGLISSAREAAAMVEGRKFIDFTLPDRSGTEQTLSELIEGKTAVLELWASWCRSCRVKAKTFKPLYEKYQSSGFTVIGIAREYRNIDKWIKALDADEYPWPNMVALEDNHNIWAQYGSPDAAGKTLLIDKDGKIVRIDPTAQEVEEYLNMHADKNTTK